MNRTALIELIRDSLSIHTIKQRSPAGYSLSDHFFAKFVKGTPECVAAQRRFTESLAAYSIITYLLQVRADGQDMEEANTAML
jgi:phosphatidylinositol 4-kinase